MLLLLVVTNDSIARDKLVGEGSNFVTFCSKQQPTNDD